MSSRTTLPLFSLSLLVPTLLLAKPASDSLKDASQGLFRIGAALNAGEIEEKNERSVRVVDRHFNSITPENVLKWALVHPEPGRYNFALPDKYVEFGKKRGMFIVGHTLVWHQQTPDWVFKNSAGGDASREELLQRLREHIRTVVARYRGQIHGWDVVNEAIDDSTGELRTDRPWYRILGEDAVFEAFAAAREADPQAELYYNDYSLDNPKKRAGVIKLVERIRAKGLRIDGIGTQEHHLIDSPSIEKIEATIVDLKKTGLKVHVTELDVSMLPRPNNQGGADLSTKFAASAELDPYKSGLPENVQAALTRRYAEIFGVYVKHHDAIERVTLWGVGDATSWLNGWPIPGRTDHPLLFDRNYEPKPAVQAVLQVLTEKRN
jgi:endo-1,4-beta-xylanase